ncbi:MAG: hypothetical protein ACR2KE_10235 [Candidatus Nanopelagicales bacterium]
MAAHDFATFIADLEVLVSRESDEHQVAHEVAQRLRRLLAGGFTLPPEFCRTGDGTYVMYPLHVDPDGRFSVAAAVWDVGQATPVHGHETWGVVGIYSGIEGETRYVKPAVEGVPLEIAEADLRWRPGDVAVCCTTDDDVHRVECVGDTPCIGIHVYGADIGTLPRRAYDLVTGEVRWFTSSWGAA